MAFDFANLYNVPGMPPGFGFYIYKSDTDTRATVAADGYFNNIDDYQNLKADDTIIVVGDEGGYQLAVTAVTSGSVSTSVVGPKSIVAKTSTYTATLTDDVILADGTFTITLPTAVGNGGQVITVKNIGSGLITVDANGSETIDGGLTALINEQYMSITMISDGSNWSII